MYYILIIILVNYFFTNLSRRALYFFYVYLYSLLSKESNRMYKISLILNYFYLFKTYININTYRNSK